MVDIAIEYALKWENNVTISRVWIAGGNWIISHLVKMMAFNAD